MYMIICLAFVISFVGAYVFPELRREAFAMCRAETWRAAEGRPPPFVVVFVLGLTKAYVRALSPANVVSLNKADVFVLNKAHDLRFSNIVLVVTHISSTTLAEISAGVNIRML